MVLDKRTTCKNTKYFLTKEIGHYIRISGEPTKQLFSKPKIKLITNNSSNHSVNLINFARRVINTVKEAYLLLDDKLKPFIEFTVNKLSNYEIMRYFNKSDRWVSQYKRKAFIKFATSLESSKIKNNCAGLPSLVFYKE